MDKLKRYKQLASMADEDQTDEQFQEQVDLYYEIYHPTIDNAIIGKDCPECGNPMEEGHECGEYIVPWSDAREGDKLNTEPGQDCSLCPPGDNGHHQYKIKAGCFVRDVPCCEDCAATYEMSEAYAAGELKPLDPEFIGKLVAMSDPRREEF